MRNVLRAELRKIIYLRSNWVLLLGSGLFAALGTVATVFTINSPANMGLSNTTTTQGINAVFAKDVSGYLFALIMGILIITNEYRHGTAVGTFLVTPKRTTVLYAKLITGAVAGFVVQVFSYLFAVAGAFLALSFQKNVAPVSSTILVNTFRASILSGVVLGIVGVSLGALIRNQIVAITGAVLWTLLVESLIVAFGGSLGKFLPAGAITGMVNVDFGKNAFNFSTRNFLSPMMATLLLLAYAAIFSTLAIKITLRKDID